MNERRSRNLDAVLAAAAAPAYADERNEQAFAAVLTAFREAGTELGTAERRAEALIPAPRTSAEEPARRARQRALQRGGSHSLRLAAQYAAVLGIFVGAGTAAASAGILPSPMQSFAHQILGGLGVPGPSPESSPSGGSTASASPDPSATAGGPQAGSTSGTEPGEQTAGTPAPSGPATQTALQSLCGQVVSSEGNWRKVLSGQDKAQLIAAAGSEKKVYQYCTDLLNLSGGAGATPATTPAEKTGGPSPSTGPNQENVPTPQPSSTSTHGKGKGGGGNGDTTSGAMPTAGV
ncbi:hypothetical protein KGA66_10650 [Actinocrinis puniceicyclus]|uniref:Uncharacterized protein n=1 Tax=Actinocrinis puniceicyclus TaxID=977794 RepID=A0A8J7WNR9_9ACTN|nr:hypothetical protein [Actinocrinis puniceicyclus]MBS2963507.1 hypothetical protein [Actinocrinis puniceicyclus]